MKTADFSRAQVLALAKYPECIETWVWIASDQERDQDERKRAQRYLRVAFGADEPVGR